MKTPDVIVIGASAGGVTAVQKILEHLPKMFQLPVVVAQHLPRDANFDMDLVFGRFSQSRVLEAKDKMPLEKGHVYFAPPSYHLLIEKDRSLALTQDEPVQFARPSIDVLFESAAESLGPALCGILLTGANADGARGLQSIQELGGLTIVQDPHEAETRFMPEAALQLMKPDYILKLHEISMKLGHWAERGQA